MLLEFGENTSPVYLNIKTAAHNSASFVITRGYHGSNRASIQCTGMTYTANGGYPNIKGLKVIKSGTAYKVVVRLFRSGSHTSFELHARAWGGHETGDIAFETTLTDTFTETAVLAELPDLSAGASSKSLSAAYANDTMWSDGATARFGNASDLQIYHDGSNSYISETNANSDLLIRSNHIILQAPSGENMIHCDEDGAVQLYHNNSSKLQTTSSGANVTGTLDLDNLTINGAQGSDGQVLTSTGSGIAWEDANGGGADNLGNHTATTNLNMGGNSINSIALISSTHLSTAANINSTGDGGATVGGGRLGFDQSGTRSWTMKASGGNLNVFSGDGNGNFSAGTKGMVASKYFDGNDTTYYLDPASNSILNQVSFGVPGNGTNNKSRFFSIEGNADGSGEGSSRIFFTEHNSTTAAMSKYGMSLGYRGGNTSITGTDGNSWTGLQLISNGQWGMWGHNNSAQGALIMYGDRAGTFIKFDGNNLQEIGTAHGSTSNFSGYQLNGTFVMDSSRNLVNIGTINSGNILAPFTFVSEHSVNNTAVGWYTIATNTGDRAQGRFRIIDQASSRHQVVEFSAAHHFGTDNSNSITVLDNSFFGTSVFRYIRIKDGGTYDGAVLQVYIDNGTNALTAVLEDQAKTGSGWVLKDWIPDATDPGDVSSYSSMAERSRVDVDNIAVLGGIASSGKAHFVNSITSAGSMYSPIYYDNNDTNYYVDPNGQSRMATLNLGNSPGSGVASGYKMQFRGGGVKMTNNPIDYVSQLHFNSNVRFQQDSNDNHLIFKFGDANSGGIKMVDGAGNLHGYFYADGDDSIGILDADGNWAVQVDTDVLTGLKVNDTYRLKADTDGVILGATATTDKIRLSGNLGLGDLTHPKIAYPGKEASFDASGTSTGQIVIDLPGDLSNYDMVFMEIDIYEYSSVGATKLIFGGHNWNSGGNSNTSTTMWYNTNVQVIGAMDKPVYVGRRNDGTTERRCIAIGETTSTWSYVTVHVSKVHGACYYVDTIDYLGNWNVAQTTNTSYFTKNPTTNYNANDSITLETNGIGEANHWFGSTSVRSPIFFDLNNTTYYTDPASRSSIRQLDLNDGTVWHETTQGTGKGSIHIDPNVSTDHGGGAITFGASDSGSGTTAQGGIYVRTDGSYGTKMYLSTTNSYASGSKTSMKIDHSGHVYVTRGDFYASKFIDNANTNYYLDPLSGSVLGGTVTIHADSDSSLSVQNAGTNAIAIYAHAGDELYLGSNNSNNIRLISGGDIDVVGNVLEKGKKHCTASIGNSYVRVFAVSTESSQLASVVRVTGTAHGSSHVGAFTADIICNHHQDVHIKSQCGNYTDGVIKVESDNNGQYTMSYKSGSSNAATYYFTIEALSSEMTITTNPSSTSSTATTHEHKLIFGTSMSGEGGSEPHLCFASNDGDTNVKLERSGDGLQVRTGNSGQFTHEFHQNGFLYTKGLYDIDNTDFFLDPDSSGSKMVNLNLISDGTHNTNDAALYVQRTGNEDWGVAVKGNSNATEYGIKVDLAGSSATMGYAYYSAGTLKYLVGHSSAIHHGDMRSPKFFDSNDTNYYLDPASTSVLNNLTLNDLTVNGTLTYSTVNAGVLEIDGKKVLDMPSNSTERGPWNPIATFIRGAGTALYGDEDFASGVNNITVYNNSGGNVVTHTREDATTNSGGAAPNSSGKVIRINHNGGTSSPGLGGFRQPIPSADNQTFVQVFQAKLRVGSSLVIAENAQGSNNTSYFLTDTAGTGKWEWYVRVSHCGVSGNFHGGGHIYVTGGSGNFNWYLASCETYKVTDGRNKRASDFIATQTITTPEVFVDNHVYHNGDTDTHLSFDTNQVKLTAANGKSRFRVLETEIEAGQDVGSNTQNYSTKLRLKGKNNYSDGTNWYGNYGQLLFHSNTNMTGSSRRYLFTNGYQNNQFAIVQSVDASTDPSVNDSASGVNSGGLVMTWNNSREVTMHENMYAPRYYDSVSTTRYLDPGGVSSIGGINTNGGGINLSNGNISNANKLTFNDAGAGEGVQWNGGNIWQIYESPNNQTNASGNLQFTSGSGNGTIRMTLDTSGNLTVSADVVAFSDERLKTNIETLDGSKVYEMRGVSYIKDDKQGSGVIAQELEKVAPELVNNDSEYKSVAYGNITGYLIEAIKDLKAEIEELKKQIK
tara:strand:- start:2988 stop:9413 length:6426 start_codon:yes stop_codon:yes gene_type:complete